MSTPNRLKLPIALAIVAFAALALGVWFAARLLPTLTQSVAPELESATYLAGGKSVVDFQLIDHHGESFDNDRLTDHWTFMFFGFTYCPDICPMSLTVLSEVEQRIAETHGDDVPLQSIFVSVDPERDTPERLSDYVGFFSPNILGVTGTDRQLERFTRDLGILYIRHEADANGNYMVDHSSSVLLFDPDGNLAALFRAPHQPDPMERDFTRILRAF